MSNTQIRTTNLIKQYSLGGSVFKALDGISLAIGKGDFFSIVGKSGSGKSTLMHILGLLDRPTEGRVFFANRDISTMDDTELATLRSNEIGFVFQSFNLLARTSSFDNVILPSVYTSKKYNVHMRAMDLLARVGLSDKLANTPSQLSGGQQQRVAIARALVNDPSVILADEPTGNLDSKSGEEVLALLEELHKEGKTVIIVTHDGDIAARADTTVRLADGKIALNASI